MRVVRIGVFLTLVLASCANPSEPTTQPLSAIESAVGGTLEACEADARCAEYLEVWKVLAVQSNGTSRSNFDDRVNIERATIRRLKQIDELVVEFTVQYDELVIEARQSIPVRLFDDPDNAEAYVGADLEIDTDLTPEQINRYLDLDLSISGSFAPASQRWVWPIDMDTALLFSSEQEIIDWLRTKTDAEGAGLDWEVANVSQNRRTTVALVSAPEVCTQVVELRDQGRLDDFEYQPVCIEE